MNEKINANGDLILSQEAKEEKIKKLTKLFEDMLDILGFDRNDQNLKRTPERIAKMYINELLYGVYNSPPDITVFQNDKKVNSMIVLGPIRVNSLCSHHFVPFIGWAYVGYIPNKKITGISKLARIVNWFARRPQIQEELTEQIADFVEEKLKPLGVGVYITAQHGCMQIRGIQEPNAWMTTMALRGVFYNIEVREEFLKYVRR